MYLVVLNPQNAISTNKGLYINPYGSQESKEGKFVTIPAGQRLEVNGLRLYNSGTFTSYILHLESPKGENVKIDLPDSAFTKKHLGKLGFNILNP